MFLLQPTFGGNPGKKLCDCEAVEVWRVCPGKVVLFSSWRRSAKPLLHSFQGSNPCKKRKTQPLLLNRNVNLKTKIKLPMPYQSLNMQGVK